MFVTYSEHTFVIIPPEEGDGPWLDQGSTGVDVTLNTLHRTPPQGCYENCERALYGVEDIPVGDTAHIVLVVYEDGDTFGSSGYWCVAGIASTPESAEAIRLRCEGQNDTDRAYRPWDGYFARLTDASVVPLTVLA